MVSPLSSRIMNAEAKANINCRANSYRPLTAHVIGEWQRRAKKRVSGYTADRSEGESPPASLYSVDKESGQKEMRARQVESLAKRRKIEESNFQAFNVKNDLAKAGIHSLPGTRSHPLPRGSVDMDKVQLVKSSKETPYVGDQTFSNDEKGNRTPDCHLQHRIEDYSDLYKQVQHFYTSKHQIPTPSEEAGTKSERSSSISSNQSTCCPKLTSIDEEVVSAPRINHKFIHQSVKFDSTHTFEDAIISCDSARLIVNNAESLTVIYGNAAFFKMTGLASDNFIGQPMTKVFHRSKTSQDHQPAILAICSALQKNNEDEGSRAAFSFTASPIGSNGEITHLILDFSKAPSNSVKMNRGDASIAFTQSTLTIG